MAEFNVNRAEADDEVEIDLLPLLQALKKKLFLILLTGAIFGAAVYVATQMFVTPLYRTSFTVYVNNRVQSDDEMMTLSSADITASRNLASTYKDIITSRSVIIPAAERCGMSMLKYEELEELVSAENSTTSEIITVYVKGTSPLNAMYLAQAISYDAEERISTIVEGTSMKVIDEPYEPEEIYSPHYVRNAAIGFILGALLVCAIVIIKELLDDRVKDEQSLEERFGIPVLGTIPNFQDSTKNRQGYYGGYESVGTDKGTSKKPARKSAPKEDK